MQLAINNTQSKPKTITPVTKSAKASPVRAGLLKSNTSVEKLASKTTEKKIEELKKENESLKK